MVSGDTDGKPRIAFPFGLIKKRAVGARFCNGKLLTITKQTTLGEKLTQLVCLGAVAFGLKSPFTGSVSWGN